MINMNKRLSKREARRLAKQFRETWPEVLALTDRMLGIWQREEDRNGRCCVEGCDLNRLKRIGRCALHVGDEYKEQVRRRVHGP